MQGSTIKAYARVLSRGAALVIVGGLAAGCSSDASRFADGLYTSAVPVGARQQPAASQPYPGDLDKTATGSVASDPARLIPGGRVVPNATVGNAPVYRQSPTSAYPAQPQAAYRAAQPYPGDARVASAPSAARQAVRPPVEQPAVQRQALAAPAPAVDRRATGSTSKVGAPVNVTPVEPRAAAAPQPLPVSKPAPASASEPAGNGWTASGGTRVTLREGETIYNLSKRFGVPAKEILRVNGISNPRDVASGQSIVIPTYVYSSNAPTSAPDANPQTIAAKSSRGTKFDVPSDRVPVPSDAPRQQVAMVREEPKPRPQRQQVEAATSPAPRKVAAEAPSADGRYTVVAGDSLYAIARRHGVTVAALKSANGLSNGNLRIGQKLAIPAGGEPVQTASTAKPNVDPIITGGAGPSAKSGKELPTYTPPKHKDEAVIRQAEKVAAVAPETTGIGKLRWPVRGRVISAFGANSGGKANDGIDIAVPAGTPVKAAENGVVIYSGSGLKEFGNTVLVRHDDGLVSVYGHNSELLVSRGDKVRRGQEIARAGNSGSAGQPKLHFEIRKNSNPVNPVKYLE
ncbi:peptigoglycan-binding protein LysM [Zhengella mangrovi]|uniref:Peptigoglycan-binding protein LysM n=1 Tax=Zhengella mangrovi TaxID=1982044 RepID=A0A2G1QR46_9HYPH|nr:peptidoglycan DD-metalloendopeptidase family protein [Zhengella mangrovi]PHP67972.1 peptigoglycan-binding protein LysM [Zhengella mangrovi]